MQLHKQVISELLHNLCENGLLVSFGKGRGTKYKLPDSYGNLFTQKVASSDDKVASSGGKVASSDNKVASSGGKVASSDDKVASSKQRLRRKELEKLICQVCRNWISLDEMAEMAGKNNNYLRNRILPKMIAEKKIEMMFPTTPRHPRQKYKTKD